MNSRTAARFRYYFIHVEWTYITLVIRNQAIYYQFLEERLLVLLYPMYFKYSYYLFWSVFFLDKLIYFHYKGYIAIEIYKLTPKITLLFLNCIRYACWWETREINTSLKYNYLASESAFGRNSSINWCSA